MQEVSFLTFTFVAGIMVGGFFFGGLWWSTKKAVLSKKPVVWFMGSLLVRLSVTITAFYFISQNHWERMLVCLLGFVVARTIVMRITQFQEAGKISNKGG